MTEALIAFDALDERIRAARARLEVLSDTEIDAERRAMVEEEAADIKEIRAKYQNSKGFFTLGDVLRPTEPISWIVQDLIPAATLSTWYGAPGVGKTWIAQYVMMRVALGLDAFPPVMMQRGESEPYAINDVKPLTVSQSPVLFIEMDQAKSITLNRFKMLSLGMELSPGVLKGAPLYGDAPESMNLATVEDVNELKTRIRVYGARLVFIDNLAYVSGSIDENSADMKQIMHALRNICESESVAIIVIHHERKENQNGNRPADRLRGSSAILGALDMAIHVTKDANNVITLNQTKNRLSEAKQFYVSMCDVTDEEGERRAIRFYGMTQEDQQDTCNREIQRAIIDAVKESAPDTQSQLVELVKGRLEKSGIKLPEKGRDAICRNIYKLVDDGKLLAESGGKRAKRYVIKDNPGFTIDHFE